MRKAKYPIHSSLMIDQDTYDAVRGLADRDQVSISDVYRDCIKEGIEVRAGRARLVAMPKSKSA